MKGGEPFSCKGGATVSSVGGGLSVGPTVWFCSVMRWTCAFGFVSVLLGNAPCGLSEKFCAS
ncbi:hypothetical protein HanIR_Chr06g0294251 [Helianthus annuus]|nr:hypothetical protein HanIR_Chr06g0294251 [Helianthus annuus]